MPNNPHENPNNGSTFRSVLPSKSSQENTVVAEQNAAPSLIFDEIQKVWAETANPKNVIICSPAVTRHRVVCITKKREDNETANEFTLGKEIKKQKKKGKRKDPTKS